MKKLILSLLFLIPLLVFSQQNPIGLFQQFNGRYDFTAIGNTLNAAENGTSYCDMLSESSATLNLSATQSLVSAHLYWSSIGPGDFQVDINGTAITAERTFSHTFRNLPYFAAYADVTNLLLANGNGVYTFSGLDVMNILSDYCSPPNGSGSGTNFGGWAIYIIYEDPTDPDILLNQISLFDGLEGVNEFENPIEITLTDISVASDELSKIGFLAWEGDRFIDNQESLYINGQLISDPPLNPSNNAFNGTNSYIDAPGNAQNYNMDLDFYDLVGIVEPGDSTIEIKLTSDQDWIMVNNIITSVNSELPDATITIDNLGVLCADSTIEVDYTVYNINSTAALPAGTPIAFYADAVLLGQTQTNIELPIDGSESGTINLNIPVGTPQIFTLKAVVDDNGTGVGIVLETNEENNEFEQTVDLAAQGLFITGNNESCEGQTETLTANFNDLDTYNWFLDGNPYGGNTPTINVTQSGVYTVSGNKAACFVEESPAFIVTFNPQAVAHEPLDLFRCDNGTQTNFFDLTQNDVNVLGGQNSTVFEVKYFETYSDSENNINTITTPGAYPMVGPSPQTIYVRIHDRAQEMCYDLEQFEIYYTPISVGVLPSMALCDQDENGSEDVNLPLEFDAVVLDGQNASEFNITYHNTLNEAQTRANPLPIVYPVSVPGETIFARIETVINPDCFLITSVEITVDSLQVVNENPDPLVACDSDSNGFTDFFLHNADEDITGGDPTLTVTYHYTLSDAQTNEGVLPEPFENIIPYNDEVYARIESPNSTCYTTVLLKLEVRDSPMLNEPSVYRICDDNNDGFEIFNLTTKQDEILNGLDPLQYDIYYYASEQDAIDAGISALENPDFSQAIANPTAYQNIVPNTQIIYVLGVGSAANTTPNNGGQGCYTIVELELIVEPSPVGNEPVDYHLCDDTVNGSTATDQISTFDLTSKNNEITGGIPNLVVTWFETFADEAADNPIANPTAYQNITNAQTIVARVANTFECKSLVTLTLVVDPLPTPAVPDPLELCDEGDGFAEFDLSLRTNQIMNGELDVTVKYYPTEAEAEVGGAGEIVAPFLYTNVIAFNDSVWARVEKNESECYAIVQLQLIVIPLPDAPDANFLDPYIVCDLNGDGFGIFDLTIQNSSVYGIQNPTDFAPISYYEVESDAITGINQITQANEFSSMGQTIYVRLENLNTGCYRVSSFDLEVGEFPGSGTAEDLELCDDEVNGSTSNDQVSTFDLTLNTPLITNNDATLTVTYYKDANDLANNIPIDNPTAFQNTSNPHEIFVSISNQQDCMAELSFNLIVNPLPVPVEPTPLVVCDMDNDGIVSDFDLESKSDEISGGNTLLNVSYHETLQDANTGNFPLQSPYENIIAYNQTIFVRVAFEDEPDGTGCFDVTTLELIVNPTPIVPQDLPDLILCGDDNFAVFDLTVQEDLIFGSQSTSDFTLTYHESEASAALGTDVIAQPESYTNTSNPQTIWVRLSDNVTECYKLGEFDLVVQDGVQIIDPTPLSLCDDLGEANDGITTFDLTVKNSEITGGVLTHGVSYFITEEDAQDNINPIDPDTAYVNVDTSGNAINPQVLYIRVEDSDSGCLSFTTLTIRVKSNPEPATPDPIVLCDNNLIIPPGPYDETELFDLTSRNNQILNGNTTWTLDYYLSYENAVSETDAIPEAETTAYQNISNPQTIYVRTTNPTSLCFEIVELELIVNPIPDDTAEVSPYVVCISNDSGIGIFNLNSKVDEILNGQSLSIFEVSFYTDIVDAENQTNAIVNTTTYQNRDANNNAINPQIIYTGILNTETGCYVGGNQSFELQVNREALANTPAQPFVVCDNLPPSDGFTEFDLYDLTDPQVQDLHNEILDGQDPANFQLTFYETIEGAESGEGAIEFPYVNIINPQRIYVRVTNESNTFIPKCYAVVEMILKVNYLPTIVFDDEYRLCVDENGNPIPEEEGSVSPPVIDTSLDPNLYSFMWDLNGVLVPGETGPSITALEEGVYTVTIIEIATGCETTASTTVTLSSPPLTYEAVLSNGAFAGNHIIEVLATGIGEYQYQLDNGPFQTSNIFENVSPGVHLITIKDVNGCGSVTFEVSVIDYPQYFTPNEDGYHDTWNIYGIGASDPTAKIYIFDRFGKLLKQLSPTEQGWDGTYNGTPLPSSDYWFRVEYKEDDQLKEFKGHFTLKR